MEQSNRSEILIFKLLASLCGLLSLLGLSLLLWGEPLAHAQDDYENMDAGTDNYEQPEYTPPPAPDMPPPPSAPSVPAPGKFGAQGNSGTSGFQGGNRKFSNPFADIQSQKAREAQQKNSRNAVRVTKPGEKPKAGDEIRIQGSTSDPDDVPNPVYQGDTVEVGGQKEVLTDGQTPAVRLSPEAFGIDASIKVKDFNFPDADIIDVAKTLGKLTGKNFILEKKVTGKVSIISNSVITVGDAWKAFLTALDINQLTLLPSGKYIRIARQRDARDKQLNTYTDARSPDIDNLVTRIFSLKFIDSEEVARTFRSFVPPNARIIPYDQTNSVIITDTGSNIKKLERMLQYLDVPGFDAGIEVVGVEHASAAELAKLIDSLLPGQPAPGLGGSRRGQAGGGSGNSFAARKTKGGGIINTIIADERTNNLIVHANAVGTQQVRELVRKLDRRMPALRGGGKIHVIYLKFSDAEEIAKTLNDLGQTDQNRRQNTGIPRSGSSGGRSTGVNPVTSSASLFEGSIKVSADKATNSLVVTASPADFVVVQRVVNQLDIDRDQVYVEALIMEMTLNNDFDYSINVAKADKGIFLSPRGDLITQLTQPGAQKGLILSGASKSKSEFTIGGQTVEIPNWLGIVKAIQTNSEGNILATPQILTLDNVEATFEATEKIPVPTQTATAGGNVTSGVTTQPVGLVIKVKPQINKVSNFVKMSIDATLSDIVSRDLPAAVATQAFATFDRKANTTVVVADGDTIILGGLIRDNHSDVQSKIPILGDIPILGWLFKGTNRSTRKTNLLIFMTPHIIRHYEKARALLDKKLKQRDDFLEKNIGGRDPYREARDEMIKGLPDIRELLQKDADTAFTVGSDDEAPTPADPEEAPDSKAGNSKAVLPEVDPTPRDLEQPDDAARISLPPLNGETLGEPTESPLSPPPVDEGTQFIDELQNTD